MREDIKKIVFLDDKKNEGVFKSYGDAKAVAKKILDSYLKQRTVTTLPSGRQIKTFYPDDILKTSGVLSNIYGYTGVLSLVNRMEATLSKAEAEELSANACWIIDELTENGFLLTPYLTQEENKITFLNGGMKDYGELFSHQYPYIGTMTWALSFLVSVRRASLSKIIEIDEEHQAKLIALVRDIILEFNSSCIVVGGELKGWAYTRECKTASLFFTYSVLEAYSDFEDNVMPVKADVELEKETGRKNTEDLELLNAINEGLDFEEDIQVIWEKMCKQVAKNVWNVYKDVLRDDFVDDGFLNGYKKVSRDDILKSNSSNALFNSIYLVFIFIYGYVNDDKENPEIDPDDVLMTMNAALQNVQRVYEQLKKEGMEYLVETYVIPFKSKHEYFGDEYIKRLNAKMLIDNTLLPALVKANNMIAFYITEYPVKQMGTLFRELFENIHATEWVWESGKYDVKITERYIESIADFYKYYEKYERFYGDRYSKNKKNEAELRADLTSELEPQIRQEVQEELAAQHAEDLVKKEAEVSGRYVLENLMRQTIREEATALLSTAMQKTIEANLGSNEKLSGFNKAFAETFPQLLFSYVLRTTVGMDFEKTTPENVAKRLKTEANDFLEKWIKEIIRTGYGINTDSLFDTKGDK